MVSVSVLLADVLKAQAKLLGGVGGIQRQVTWAVTMHSRPPAFGSLQGGEAAVLSLATLSALQAVDSSLTLAKVVESLAKAEVAAVLVAGLEEHLLSDEVKKAIALADERSLPLISLPRQLLLADIERDIIAWVAYHQRVLSQRVDEVYQELVALGLRRAGIQTMIERLAVALGKLVILEDEYGQILQYAAPDHPWPDAEELRRLLRSHLARLLFPRSFLSQPHDAGQRGGVAQWIERQDFTASRWARLVTPLRFKQHIAGYLSLLGDSQQIVPLDRQALEQVAPLFALELGRVQELAEMEQRLHGDALDAVLQARSGDHLQALAGARQAGYNLSGSFVVVVFQVGHSEVFQTAVIKDLDEEVYREGEGSPSVWVRRLMAELERCFPSVMLRMRARELVMVLPIADGAEMAVHLDRLKRRLVEVLVRLKAEVRQEVGAGVGRVAASATELALRLREAEQALLIGHRFFPDQPVTSFAELGIYRLLFYLSDSREVQIFYEEVLGPLVAYDRRTENELVPTLETYFACNGNLSKAARRLHLHRNSLLYRLERIQEVLHADLEDAETRLSLQVALKVQHLLPH